LHMRMCSALLSLKDRSYITGTLHALYSSRGCPQSPVWVAVDTVAHLADLAC
jgi:hypothetical protein